MALKEVSQSEPVSKPGRNIVLIGNPNVGKSVVFNALTGTYTDVANYPGTTLDLTCSRFGQDIITDTPGIYGISSFNEEERIARDIILQADIVINVVDAVHLARDLFLTQQIIDAGVSVIVVLNMIDEALIQGLEIDVPLLEKLLGVPIITTIAVKNQGIEDIRKRWQEARPGITEFWLAELLSKAPIGLSQGEYLFILEGDPEIADRCGLPAADLRDEIYNRRRKHINHVIKQIVKEGSVKETLGSALSRWMLQPLTGIPFLLLTLWGMYWLIGVFIAQTVVGYTDEVLMVGYYEPAVRNFVRHYIDLSSFWGTILTGQFGLLTMTVTLVFGLLLPLVTGFFIVISVLEDTGYLPRIATLVDRVLLVMGLNGRSIIPLILGFGCVTMAAITTKLLGSDREKRIALFLLCLGVPCSAQLAFITSLLVSLGGHYIILFILVISGILITSGSLLGRFLPGEPSPLFIELPPLRLPILRNVFTKTWNKSYEFIKEAIPLFTGGALLLGILEATGSMEAIQNFLVPITVGWLKLPKEAASSLLMGFIRRDFGTAGIIHMSMLPAQKFVALVTLTLFMPCIAATLVVLKERGWREGLFIWGAVFFLAFFLGGLLARLFGYFNVAEQGINFWPVVGTLVLFFATALGVSLWGKRSILK